MKLSEGKMLAALGLHEWEIISSHDPWCRQSTKTLFVLAGDKHSLLHEATHALIGGGHRRHFWTLFESMADYFLGGQLPAYQERMKQDYLRGEQQ